MSSSHTNVEKVTTVSLLDIFILLVTNISFDILRLYIIFFPFQFLAVPSIALLYPKVVFEFVLYGASFYC